MLKISWLIYIVSDISRLYPLGWMIILVLHIRLKKNVTWTLDAGCSSLQIPCIPLLTCLRRKANEKRYNNEQPFLNTKSIFNFIDRENEMMQEYGSTAKLLSDFEILNQVRSSLSSCLKLLFVPSHSNGFLWYFVMVI